MWDTIRIYLYVERCTRTLASNGGISRNAILSESNEGCTLVAVLILLIQLVDNLQFSNATRTINRNRLICREYIGTGISFSITERAVYIV